MNHYERLGTQLGADFQTLKKCYYAKVKECHPDLFNNSKAKEEEFKKLVAAFDILSDPEKRRNYDRAINVAEEYHEDDVPLKTEVPSRNSIMDTDADDTLEELFVGNNPPSDTSLATLFLDLARTQVFITFREGKNLYYGKKYKDAQLFFSQAVSMSPGNILYRYFLGMSYAWIGQYSKARFHLKAAVNIGDRRVPPQALDRIHEQLEMVKRKSMPFWHSVASLFSPLRERPQIPVDEQMIAETNKALARLMASDKKRKRKMLK